MPSGCTLLQDLVVRIVVHGLGLGAATHGHDVAQNNSQLVELRVVHMVLVADIVRSDVLQRKSRVLFQELARLLDGLVASCLLRVLQGLGGGCRVL